MRRRLFPTSLIALPVLLASPSAFAQNGEPPPDAKSVVAAPTGPAASAGIDEKPPEDHTTASVSAGGQLANGNSHQYAGNATGIFEMRRGQNAFGFNLVANYGEAQESPAPTIKTTGFGTPAQLTTYTFPNGSSPSMQETVENVQGRLRYDRFVSKTTSFFALFTGRHDKFQGLEFRLNVDPGVKQILYGGKAYSLWGELGYDFQYDYRYADALHPTDPVFGLPLPGLPPGGLPQTDTDHSGRAYIGFRDALGKDMTLTTGFELLQSLIHSQNTRFNVDALLAAKVYGNLSVGLAWSLRYDNNPLPGKVNTDSTETATLIYSYSDAAAKKKGDKKPGDCDCEKTEEPPSNPNKYLPPAPPPEFLNAAPASAIPPPPPAATVTVAPAAPPPASPHP